MSEEVNSEVEQLSEAQLFDVLTFASNMYNYNQNGVWTPWTQHDNLINLNNNPIKPDYNKIVKALETYKESSNNLSDYSEFMKVYDSIYAKIQNYYGNMLSFNYRITCNNYKDPKELNTEDYKKDKARFYKFMKRLNYKREFHGVVQQLLRNGKYFCTLRTTEGVINDNPLSDTDDLRRLPSYALQTLPQKQCMITGKSNDCPLFDFDFNYFLSPQTDINLYSPSFRKQFRDIFNSDEGGINYNPHAQYNGRDGMYVMWGQLSPDDGNWCFLFDYDNAVAVPPFAYLMKATYDNTEIHKLQMNKNLASAYALLYGSIPLLSGAKSGERADNLAYKPETLGKFMNLVSSGLKSIMKTVAVPLEDARFGQFQDVNVSMEQNGLDASSGQGAFANSIIYSSGKKISEEVKNGIIADYNLMAKLYPQFQAFCEFYGNKKTAKYKFSVNFDGGNYPIIREENRKKVTELADKGIVLPQAISQAFDFDPQEFETMMAEAKYGGFSENLTMLLNINTSKGDKESGGQTKSDGEISSAGENTRDYE